MSKIEHTQSKIKKDMLTKKQNEKMKQCENKLSQPEIIKIICTCVSKNTFKDFSREAISYEPRWNVFHSTKTENINVFGSKISKTSEIAISEPILELRLITGIYDHRLEEKNDRYIDSNGEHVNKYAREYWNIKYKQAKVIFLTEPLGYMKWSKCIELTNSIRDKPYPTSTNPRKNFPRGTVQMEMSTDCLDPDNWISEKELNKYINKKIMFEHKDFTHTKTGMPKDINNATMMNYMKETDNADGYLYEEAKLIGCGWVYFIQEKYDVENDADVPKTKFKDRMSGHRFCGGILCKYFCIATGNNY